MTDTETVAKKTDAARALREAYAALKAEKPEMRVRDAARDLSVSEGELVAAAVGDSVVRLAGEGNRRNLPTRQTQSRISPNFVPVQVKYEGLIVPIYASD